MSDHGGEHLGTYHLLRLLGRGGFATVYLGEGALLAVQHEFLQHNPIPSIRAVYSSSFCYCCFASRTFITIA
jgi:hypothetical protein